MLSGACRVSGGGAFRVVAEMMALGSGLWGHEVCFELQASDATC